VISKEIPLPLILDLCGGTGGWSEPYRKAGYDVLIVDPLRNWTVELFFVLLQTGKEERRWIDRNGPVRGILAAPPCTEFSSAGARHWNTKNPALLDRAIATVRACYDIVQLLKPEWWALENPTGRIQTCCPFLGKKKATFHPWEYGDNWIKQTHLWGDFVMPPKTVTTRPFTAYDRTHRMSEASGRATLRSITPPRFAEAFFRSNP
jgi:hypothetical protein